MKEIERRHAYVPPFARFFQMEKSGCLCTSPGGNGNTTDYDKDGEMTEDGWE